MAPIPNDGSGNDDDTNSSEVSQKKNILITKRVETKKLKKNSTDSIG